MPIEDSTSTDEDVGSDTGDTVDTVEQETNDLSRDDEEEGVDIEVEVSDDDDDDGYPDGD